MAETLDDGRISREDFDFNATAAERGRERGSQATRLCLRMSSGTTGSGSVHKQKNVRSQADVVMVVDQGCFARHADTVAGLRSLCTFFVTITIQNRGQNHFNLQFIPLSPHHFYFVILPPYHIILSSSSSSSLLSLSRYLHCLNRHCQHHQQRHHHHTNILVSPHCHSSHNTVIGSTWSSNDHMNPRLDFLYILRGLGSRMKLKKIAILYSNMGLIPQHL